MIKFATLKVILPILLPKEQIEMMVFIYRQIYYKGFLCFFASYSSDLQVDMSDGKGQLHATARAIYQKKISRQFLKSCTSSA